jgi:hypothetical protein
MVLDDHAPSVEGSRDRDRVYREYTDLALPLIPLATVRGRIVLGSSCYGEGPASVDSG